MVSFMNRARRFLLLVLAFGTIAGVAAAADRPAILVLGDSLSAAYGIPVEQGWVNLLRERLRRNDAPHEVINASISGETTEGGLSRLPTLLQRYDPAVVILELGGNDGLRGLPPQAMAENLARMVTLARGDGARVLLVGMQMPPNYGPAFTRRFRAVYRDVAQAQDVPLVPFLLAGVAGDPALMQADGMHAEAAAQPTLLENVWRELKKLL